jgi:hypothetical protein
MVFSHFQRNVIRSRLFGLASQEKQTSLASLVGKLRRSLGAGRGAGPMHRKWIQKIAEKWKIVTYIYNIGIIMVYDRVIYG